MHSCRTDVLTCVVGAVMMADTMMTTRDALKAEIRLMDGVTKPGNAAHRT